MRTAEAATTATTTQQAKREAKREAERETARTQHLPVSASPPFYAPTVNEQPTITADILLFLEEAPQGPEPQLRAEHQSQQGETILVVEDEPVVRALVLDVLAGLGYRTLEASDGAAALRILQSDARIDLLVTDVGLPVMNGRQVYDAALATRADLKVLFMTGYAENAVVGNGHLEPGMQVLTKPFVMEVLANRIKDMISPGQGSA